MATDKYGRNVMDKEEFGLSDKDIYNDNSVLDNLYEKRVKVNEIIERPKKTEMQKLVEYLDKYEIPYVWDRRENNPTIEIHALLNKTNHGSYFYGTVSLDNGMLSVTGDLANGVKDSRLTAEEVIARMGEEKEARLNPEYIEQTQSRTIREPKEKQVGVVYNKLHAYAKQQEVIPREPVNKKTQAMDR